MDKDDRQHGSPEQVDGSRESQREPRPAPGKVTRTSKLSSGRGEQVQRKAAASTPAAASQPARSSGDFTADLWMDASHRGVTALAERGADSAVVARQAAGPGTIDSATPAPWSTARARAARAARSKAGPGPRWRAASTTRSTTCASTPTARPAPRPAISTRAPSPPAATSSSTRASTTPAALAASTSSRTSWRTWCSRAPAPRPRARARA